MDSELNIVRVNEVRIISKSLPIYQVLSIQMICQDREVNISKDSIILLLESDYAKIKWQNYIKNILLLDYIEEPTPEDLFLDFIFDLKGYDYTNDSNLILLLFSNRDTQYRKDICSFSCSFLNTDNDPSDEGDDHIIKFVQYLYSKLAR